MNGGVYSSASRPTRRLLLLLRSLLLLVRGAKRNKLADMSSGDAVAIVNAKNRSIEGYRRPPDREPTVSVSGSLRRAL